MSPMSEACAVRVGLAGNDARATEGEQGSLTSPQPSVTSGCSAGGLDREGQGSCLLIPNSASDVKGTVYWFFPVFGDRYDAGVVLHRVSPELSAAARDSWPHTGLHLIMQQQAFRMGDNFPEAQPVLKSILRQATSQVGQPSMTPRDPARCLQYHHQG